MNFTRPSSNERSAVLLTWCDPGLLWSIAHLYDDLCHLRVPQKPLLDLVNNTETTFTMPQLTHPKTCSIYSRQPHTSVTKPVSKSAIRNRYGRPTLLYPAWLVRFFILLLIHFLIPKYEAKKKWPPWEANPSRYGQRMGKELKSIDWSGIRMLICKPQAKTCITLLISI